MKQFIFDKNTPSLNYIFLKWPISKYLVSKYIFSEYKKPDLLKLSLSSLEFLKVKYNKPLSKTFYKLAKQCNLNVYNNKYHNPHHSKAVLIVAVIFARKLKLNGYEAFLVVLISLVHDMGHQGKRVLKNPYYQEKKTINNLNKIIFKVLLNNKKWKRIERILLNTYFSIKPKESYDNVERIILNADISSSVFFGFSRGLSQSRKLKFEMDYNDNSEVLYENFLEVLKSREVTCY